MRNKTIDQFRLEEAYNYIVGESVSDRFNKTNDVSPKLNPQVLLSKNPKDERVLQYASMVANTIAYNPERAAAATENARKECETISSSDFNCWEFFLPILKDRMQKIHGAKGTELLAKHIKKEEPGMFSKLGTKISDLLTGK